MPRLPGNLRVALTQGASDQRFTYAADGSLQIEATHEIRRQAFPGISGFLAERLVPAHVTAKSKGTLQRVK